MFFLDLYKAIIGAGGVCRDNYLLECMYGTAAPSGNKLWTLLYEVFESDENCKERIEFATKRLNYGTRINRDEPFHEDSDKVATLMANAMILPLLSRDHINKTPAEISKNVTDYIRTAVRWQFDYGSIINNCKIRDQVMTPGGFRVSFSQWGRLEPEDKYPLTYGKKGGEKKPAENKKRRRGDK